MFLKYFLWLIQKKENYAITNFKNTDFLAKIWGYSVLEIRERM